MKCRGTFQMAQSTVNFGAAGGDQRAEFLLFTNNNVVCVQRHYTVIRTCSYFQKNPQSVAVFSNCRRSLADTFHSQ